MPYRLSGPGAFFQRPEVRDVIAWLRLLADPTDAAAAVRALSRPPVELRSVDLARCTTIARRRKLDMVSALEASLESPQIPPEARDRIREFLQLHRAAARAMGEMRADVFVRRLIERIGFRRHRLFAAHPEAAERLRNLSRLGELAAAWTRREPTGSNRDFVRYLVAVSEAGGARAEPRRPVASRASRRRSRGDAARAHQGARVLARLRRRAARRGGAGLRPRRGLRRCPRAWAAAAPSHEDEARRLLYMAMTRATRRAGALPARRDRGRERPPVAALRGRPGGPRRRRSRSRARSSSGPAEGLQATYRMIQDEVLEEAWRAGGKLREPRLDTYVDVTRAVAPLPGAGQARRADPGIERGARSGLPGGDQRPARARDLARAAQRPARLRPRRVPARRGGRGKAAPRADRPAGRALAGGLPARAAGEGLALSATDIELYRTCPLKYKFARVFGIPQETTINQRFGIVIHQVLERFHGQPSSPGPTPPQDRARTRGAWSG